MISAILFFATKTLNLNISDILWNIPLACLFLMRYQHYYEERNGQLMSLGDKDFIDELTIKNNIP